MKLEITKNQAEELRTQGGKVLEETRYFAVVAHVAAEAVLPTTVVPPDPPVKKRSKRRRSTRPIVFQRDTLVMPKHKAPRFYGNTGVAAQVYDAVRLLFGTPVGANGIVRNKLEQDTVKLLPEYERPVVSKAISALITKKVLTRKGD